MKIVYIVAALFALPAIAGAVVEQRSLQQTDDLLFSDTADLHGQLAMGPNPGGLGASDDSAKATSAGSESTDTTSKEVSGNQTDNTASPVDATTEATKVRGGEAQR